MSNTSHQVTDRGATTAEGLRVLLGQLHQRTSLQLRFGQQPLQDPVLLLKLLQLLRILGFPAAVLIAPP